MYGKVDDAAFPSCQCGRVNERSHVIICGCACARERERERERASRDKMACRKGAPNLGMGMRKGIFPTFFRCGERSTKPLLILVCSNQFGYPSCGFVFVRQHRSRIPVAVVSAVLAAVLPVLFPMCLRRTRPQEQTHESSIQPIQLLWVHPESDPPYCRGR